MLFRCVSHLPGVPAALLAGSARCPAGCGDLGLDHQGGVAQEGPAEQDVRQVGLEEGQVRLSHLHTLRRDYSRDLAQAKGVLPGGDLVAVGDCSIYNGACCPPRPGMAQGVVIYPNRLVRRDNGPITAGTYSAPGAFSGPGG